MILRDKLKRFLGTQRMFGKNKDTFLKSGVYLNNSKKSYKLP